MHDSIFGHPKLFVTGVRYIRVQDGDEGRRAGNPGHGLGALLQAEGPILGHGQQGGDRLARTSQERL